MLDSCDIDKAMNHTVQITQHQPLNKACSTRIGISRRLLNLPASHLSIPSSPSQRGCAGVRGGGLFGLFLLRFNSPFFPRLETLWNKPFISDRAHYRWIYWRTIPSAALRPTTRRFSECSLDCLFVVFVENLASLSHPISIIVGTLNSVPEST